MSKSHLSWVAVVLVLAGVSVMTGHPAWGIVTGGALVLMGFAISAGAARLYERHGEPRGQRVSNNLVTLSAATIIAVYAAGFERTRAAADEFEAQAARHRVRPPTAALVAQPSASRPLTQGAAQTPAQPVTQSPRMVAMATPASVPSSAGVPNPA